MHRSIFAVDDPVSAGVFCLTLHEACGDPPTRRIHLSRKIALNSFSLALLNRCRAFRPSLDAEPIAAWRIIAAGDVRAAGMQALPTSAGRDAWLVSLIETFDSVSRFDERVDSRLMMEVERHLRVNAEAACAGSMAIH